MVNLIGRYIQITIFSYHETRFPNRSSRQQKIRAFPARIFLFHIGYLHLENKENTVNLICLLGNNHYISTDKSMS